MNGLHGIIFAYEKAPGLRELTEARMPGSVPFGGRYRVVDFMLSNMAGAGITDVGVVLHGNYQSLLDHIGSGKTWDMARKNGGLKLLPPFADARKFGVEEFRGKMEALSGVRSYLHEIRQKYVVLSDSDLIINLPLQKVLDAHIESGADITCVCTESGQFVENATYFTVNEAGRITETRCAPHKASGCRSLEIFPLWTSAPRRTNTAFAAMCSAPWAASSTCALSCGTDLPRSCARCRNTMSAACSS